MILKILCVINCIIKAGTEKKSTECIISIAAQQFSGNVPYGSFDRRQGARSINRIFFIAPLAAMAWNI